MLISFEQLRSHSVISSFLILFLLDCLEDFSCNFSVMENDESVPPTVTAAGFVSGNETNFCYSDDDVVYSEEENVNNLVGKIFLTSMGVRTCFVVISQFSLTRFSDASEIQILIFSTSTWHFHCCYFRSRNRN